MKSPSQLLRKYLNKEFITEFFKAYAKFFCVGISCNVVELITYTLFSKIIRGNYVLSNIIAGVLALSLSYLLNSFWTFKKKKITLKSVLLLIVVHIGNLTIGSILLYIYIYTLGLHYIVAKLLLSGLICTWGFFLSKYLIYK